MDQSEVDVLAYMTFPADHRAKLHSVNPPERLNGEIKRRTDVVGIFPNANGITKLIVVRHRFGSRTWLKRRLRTITMPPPTRDPDPRTSHGHHRCRTRSPVLPGSKAGPVRSGTGPVRRA